jgi:hypothetical protein
VRHGVIEDLRLVARRMQRVLWSRLSCGASSTSFSIDVNQTVESKELPNGPLLDSKHIDDEESEVENGGDVSEEDQDADEQLEDDEKFHHLLLSKL